MSTWSKIATVNVLAFVTYSVAMFIVRTGGTSSYMEAGGAVGGLLLMAIVLHILGLLITSVVNIGAGREVVKGTLMGLYLLPYSHLLRCFLSSTVCNRDQ